MNIDWDTIKAYKKERRQPFRPRCRPCRSNRDVIPIVYAEATEALLQEEANGHLIIGGTARRIEAPNWHCTQCQNRWLR